MLNNRKGVVMLVVISLIFMLLTLGAAMLIMSTGHFGTFYRQIKGIRAYYAAEAGIQHALWKCRTGAYNLEDIWVDGAGTAPKYRSDPAAITVSYPNYDYVVNVKVYEMGSDPLGTGTIADSYPIVISVVY